LADVELYERVVALTERMDHLLGGLESGRGAAGLLLHDEELYDNVSRVTLELGDLIADIRKDPKKYLSVDFSVF
jgi:phospholipid/cholesterol/gamma-HCH transport system substrate-binding protein